MRRILISGGSRGIGCACVRAFCDMGDAVAFLYHDRADAAHELEMQTGAVGYACDLSDAEQVKAAAAWAKKTLGGGYFHLDYAGCIVYCELYCLLSQCVSRYFGHRTIS